MGTWSRRQFLKTAACAAGSLGLGHFSLPGPPDIPRGERPRQAAGVTVVNPRGRVPVSLIIDDSTCLVNLAHYGIPQFQEVFPEQYQQPWRTLPREIPDAFVRRFGGWCREHGVKGKYSIVPYPACVGWVDRFMPGWSAEELRASLRLVRDFMTPDWDIHPEMISHTRVVDIRTGRPFPEASPDYMENWEWSQDKSADELAAYIAYALRILRNAELPCEGLTTPGGFAGRNQANLARATLEAVRDVYGAEIPHYFRNVYTTLEESVAPRVYYASGLDGSNPRCVVSVVGCTGDWFGGWDGLSPGSVDRFITENGQGGRLPEVIESGEPAVMLCHWPGIYFNGREVGFDIFKEVVRRLHARYDHLQWMKPSAIARYWAARELTGIQQDGPLVTFSAPFAAPGFTVAVDGPVRGTPRLTSGRGRIPVQRVDEPLNLASGTWCPTEGGATFCFDLPEGETHLHLDGDQEK